MLHALLAIVLIGAVIVTILSSRHGVGLLLFVLMSHGIFVLLIGKIATHLPLYIGICVSLVIFFKFEWTSPPLRPITFLFLFANIILISVLIGGIEKASLYKLVAYFKPILLALIVACIIKTTDDLKLMSIYIITSAILGSSFNIYQQVFGVQVAQNIWDTALSRAAGLRGDPNDTAMLLLMSLPLFYYRFLNAVNKSNKVFLTLGALLILVGIILTGSRAGFAATSCIVIFILFHNHKARKLNFVSMPSPKKLVVVILLCCVAASFAPAYFGERVVSLFKAEEVGQSRSLQSRFFLMKKGLKIWIDNPIIGVGIGNFGNALQSDLRKNQIFYSSQGYATKRPVAHNLYIEFLAEIGLVGLILFLAVCVASLSGFLKLDLPINREKPYTFIGYGFGLSLISMLIFGFTLSQGYNSALWFTLGLGISAHNIVRIESALPEKGFSMTGESVI